MLEAGPRRRQSAPTDRNSRARPQRNSAPPRPSASAFPDRNAQDDLTSSVRSTRCGRCNSPHLVNSYRDLKNRGKSLLSDLDRLLASLEALEPDPAEMEWVLDTGTVVYKAHPSLAASVQADGTTLAGR